MLFVLLLYSKSNSSILPDFCFSTSSTFLSLYLSIIVLALGSFSINALNISDISSSDTSSSTADASASDLLNSFCNSLYKSLGKSFNSVYIEYCFNSFLSFSASKVSITSFLSALYFLLSSWTSSLLGLSSILYTVYSENVFLVSSTFIILPSLLLFLKPSGELYNVTTLFVSETVTST